MRRSTSIIACILAFSQLLVLGMLPAPVAAEDIVVSGTHIVSAEETWDDITIDGTGRLVVPSGTVLNANTIVGEPGSILEATGGRIVLRNPDGGGDVSISGTFSHFNITDNSRLVLRGSDADPQLSGLGPHDAFIPASQGGNAELDVTASGGIRLENCIVTLRGGDGADLPASNDTNTNAWTTGDLAGRCAAGGNATLSLRTTGTAGVHIAGLTLDLNGGDGGLASDGGDSNSDIGGFGGGYSNGGTVSGFVGVGGDARLSIASPSISIDTADVECNGGRGGAAGNGGSTQSASNGGAGGGGYSGGNGGNKSGSGTDGGVVSGWTGSGGAAVANVQGDNIDAIDLNLVCRGGTGGQAGDGGTSHSSGDGAGGGGYGGGGGGGYMVSAGVGLVEGNVGRGGSASIGFAGANLALTGCDLTGVGGMGGRAGNGGDGSYGGGGGGGYGGGGGGGAYGGNGGGGEVRDEVGTGGTVIIGVDGTSVVINDTRFVGTAGAGGYAGDGGDSAFLPGGYTGGGGGAGYAGGGGAGGNSQSGYGGRRGGDGTVAGPVGSGGDVLLELHGTNLVMIGSTVDLDGGNGGDAGTGGSAGSGSTSGGGGGGGYGGAGGASKTADNYGGKCYVSGSIGHGGSATVDWATQPPSISKTCAFMVVRGEAGDGTASSGGGGYCGGQGSGSSTVAGRVDAPIPMSVARQVAPADNSYVKGNEDLPTLSWLDLHTSTTNGDVVDYTIELDDDPDFTSTLVSEVTTSTGYAYGQQLPLGKYYWRVMAKYSTPAGTSAGWSDVWDLSVSEIVKPISSVEALPAITATGILTVRATAEDLESGILKVDLWYSRDGGPWTLYGTDDALPISWDFDTSTTGGDGMYAFYSRAWDVARNHEDAPLANDTHTLVDTIAPVSSLDQLPPFTTEVTFDIPVSATDLNGISGIELWYKKDDGYWLMFDEAGTQSHLLTMDTSKTGGDGRYEFHSRARDVAGNLEDAPPNYDTRTTVDTTAPASKVDALPPYFTGRKLTVTSTASDPIDIERAELWYRRDDGEWTKHQIDTSPPLRWTVDLSAAGRDGTYQFYTRAWDMAGNREEVPTQADAQTILDTEAPASMVDELPAYSTNAIIDITASAFDLGGVASVELWYKKDGGTWTMYDSVTSVPYGWAFDTSGTGGDGDYQFYSWAVDVAGHVEDAPSDKDTGTIVDTRAADSKVISLPDHETSVTFEIRADASDANGVERVELWYQMEDGAWTMYGEVRSLPAVWDFDTSSTGGDGMYLFYTKARDIAGNGEDAPPTNDTWTIVDTIGPTISVVAPENGSKVRSSNIKVSCTATDTSGMARLEVRIDDDSYIEMDESGEWTFKGVSDGRHTITVRATDRYGNSQTSTLEVRVDSGTSSTPGFGVWIAIASVTLAAVPVMMRRRM